MNDASPLKPLNYKGGKLVKASKFWYNKGGERRDHNVEEYGPDRDGMKGYYMSEEVKLTKDEVATFSEEFVEQHIMPHNPEEVFQTVNSVHSFMLITNLKKLGEKEYAAYKDLDESKLYQINVLHEGSFKLIDVNKQALLNLAAGRERYGGLDLLGVKAVDYSQSTIEVKTDRDAKYLHRDKPNWSNGSLGFEIWSKPDRSTVGWAYDYVHYEQMNKWNVENTINRKTVPPTYCHPSVFVYVLSYETGLELHPYATVCFENTGALFDLVDKKLDGRLKNWRKDNKTHFIMEGEINDAYMQKNMLYISMDELCALPDVTITLYENISTECILRNCVNPYYWTEKQRLIEQRMSFLHTAVTAKEERELRSDNEQIERIDTVPDWLAEILVKL